MRCADCQWKYPESFLHQMYSAYKGSGRYTKPICGICALARRNEALGINDKVFRGEIAESARLSAINWRENHPQDKPE
jgi:hypothetical protein